MKFDTAYIIETMKRFIETPSPVGYYEKMKPVIEEYASSLGYSVTYDNRDTAYIRVEGEDTSKTVCVSAHADTLGFMVRSVNGDGTLAAAHQYKFDLIVAAVGDGLSDDFLSHIDLRGENVLGKVVLGVIGTGILALFHRLTLKL